MTDQTDRLRVIIQMDGTAMLADGTKLSAAEVRKLGDELSRTGRELESAGGKVDQTARRVGALGRELAQGDWRNAALQAGKLAMETNAAGLGFGFLGAAVGVAGAAVGAYAAIAYKAAEETNRQATALLLTGNYAGLVAGQLNQLARTTAETTGAAVGNVRQTMEALVTTGKVTTQSLTEVATAVELVARFSGQTRESVLKDFTGMTGGVAKWAADHNKAYHFLTLDQYRYIDSLEKAGNAQEAMRVTSVALSQHLGGDMSANLGTLQRAWQGVQNWASRAWDSMLNLGRPDTIQDRISKLSADLDALISRKSTGRYTTEQRDALISTVRAQLETAKESARLERRAADARSEEAQRQEDAIANEQAKKRGPGTPRVDPEIDARRRLLMELAGLSGSFEKDWERLSFLFKDGSISLDELIRGQADLLARQPAIRENIRAEEAAQKALDKARKDAAETITKNRAAAEAAALKDYQAHEREIDALVRGNEALEVNISTVGKTRSELQALKAVRIEHAIALERERLAVLANFNGSELARGQIERTLQELERQRDLTRQLGQVELVDEQRKKNEVESKKFSEDLRRDVTDSLQRAFESGKSPAAALADTLSSTIKTRVTRALAEAIANPILRPLEQALGGGGLSGFGGGFGSLFNQIPSVGFGTGFGFGSQDLGLFLHGGGMVGSEATFTRNVNPGVFAGAPRFHGGGIAGDEVPIIARKKEGVFTEGQMRALAPAGSNVPQVTVNVQTMPGQTADVRQRQSGGELSIDVIVRQLEEQMAGNISAGTGAIGEAMEGRYNLRTAVT